MTLKNWQWWLTETPLAFVAVPCWLVAAYLMRKLGLRVQRY